MIVEWCLKYTYIGVLLFFIVCFLLYLGGRLVSAGWYRSKRDSCGLRKHLYDNKGGGKDA